MEVASRLSWAVFAADDSDAAAFRNTLSNLIKLELPHWSRLIPYGRQVFLRNNTANVTQCFEIAGLMDSVDIEIVNWWDQCAALVRGAAKDPRLEVGREAERKSFEREVRLLSGSGMSPVWIALDDNTIGCDIQSWRPGIDGWNDPVVVYFEVKASTDHRHCFVSRNEWEFALRHKKNWMLQHWDAGVMAPEIYEFEDIYVHIPRETGSGIWTSVKIDLTNVEGRREND